MIAILAIIIYTNYSDYEKIASGYIVAYSHRHFADVEHWVSSIEIEYQALSINIEYWVLSIKYQVLNIEYQASSIKYQVSSIKHHYQTLSIEIKY